MSTTTKKNGYRQIARNNLPTTFIEDISRKKLLEYLEEVKVKTDWQPGEDILPKIPNYVTHFFMDNISFRLTDIPLYLPNSDYRPDEFAAATTRRKKTVCLIFENGKLVMSGAKSIEDIKFATLQYIQQLATIPQLVRVLNKDGTPMEVSYEDLEHEEGYTGDSLRKRIICGNYDENDSFLPGRTYPVYAFSTLEKVMKFQDFNLVNVVGSGIGSTKPIDLALISAILNSYSSSYEPDSFPALKFVIHQKYCPIKLLECTAHIFDSGALVFMGAPCKEDVIHGFMFVKCVIKHFVDKKALLYSTQSSRFQYRMNQQLEINENIDQITAEERAIIANKILETASVTCFGNYMYEQMRLKEEQECQEVYLKIPDKSETKKGIETELDKITRKRKNTTKDRFPTKRIKIQTENGIITTKEVKEVLPNPVIDTTQPEDDELNLNTFDSLLTYLDDVNLEINF